MFVPKMVVRFVQLNIAESILALKIKGLDDALGKAIQQLLTAQLRFAILVSNPDTSLPSCTAADLGLAIVSQSPHLPWYQNLSSASPGCACSCGLLLSRYVCSRWSTMWWASRSSSCACRRWSSSTSPGARCCTCSRPCRLCCDCSALPALPTVSCQLVGMAAVTRMRTHLQDMNAGGHPGKGVCMKRAGAAAGTRRAWGRACGYPSGTTTWRCTSASSSASSSRRPCARWKSSPAASTPGCRASRSRAPCCPG